MHAKREPKGAKGSQREPKGNQMGAKGSQGTQREPKGSQRTTKMHPKTDQGAMSEKCHQKVTKKDLKMDQFGTHFPLKIDAKINAKNGAKKTWKFMKFKLKIIPKSRSKCVEKPYFSVQLIFREQRL